MKKKPERQEERLSLPIPGLLEQPQCRISPEMGKKIVDGRGLADMTEQEINELVFGDLLH